MIRTLRPIGALLAGVWAIQELSKDRPARAAFPVVLGAYLLFSYFRTRKREARIPKIPDEFHFYEVYGFFGACVFVGVATFVLAALGVTHNGIVIGTAGLVVAGASGYAIVRETHNVRRRGKEADPPAHFDSKATES